jgi:hypothetical protein
MPVEPVELVLVHEVQNGLDHFLAEEMPALVEMNAAPRIAGGVFNLHAGNLHAERGHARQLTERLDGVVLSGGVGGDDRDAVGCYRQPVPFLRDGGVIRMLHLREHRVKIALLRERALLRDDPARQGDERRRGQGGYRHHRGSECK